MPDLVTAGIGLPAASIRGVTQTLEPIGASAQLMRTVNGTLVDVSTAAFRKYASTIRSSDQAPPHARRHLAWARLLARARTVEIQATVPFATDTGLSCRINTTTPRLAPWLALGRTSTGPSAAE